MHTFQNLNNGIPTISTFHKIQVTVNTSKYTVLCKKVHNTPDPMYDNDNVTQLIKVCAENTMGNIRLLAMFK